MPAESNTKNRFYTFLGLLCGHAMFQTIQWPLHNVAMVDFICGMQVNVLIVYYGLQIIKGHD